MLSQCCLELGRRGKRASSRQSPLMRSGLVWRDLSLCKPAFVAGPLPAFLVSSCLVLPWFPLVACGVSPLLLGLTPWFRLRSDGRRPPCQIRPALQNGSGSSREGLGGGRRAVGQGGAGQGEFSGALCITNGVGTSCGWRNGDRARLCWAGLRQPVCFPLPAAQPGGLSLGRAWDREGYRFGTRRVWSMKAELASPFSLSDSKGSLEPHKPGKCPAEIAALTHLLNISN